MPNSRQDCPTRYRHKLIALAAAFCLTALGTAVAAGPIPHIGYMTVGPETSTDTFLNAFRSALRELGYREGHDIVVDGWSAEDSTELPELAASVVATKPSLIVGTCIPSTRAAKEATPTIPIVMSVDGDPVLAGLVDSIARPGANVTGTWTLFEELVPKWIELLKLALPNAKVIGTVVNPEDLADPYFSEKLKQAARRLGVKLVRAEFTTPEGLEPAFAKLKRQRVDGIVVTTNPYMAALVDRVIALATRYRLPGIYGYREYAEAGGLMSYGVSYREYFRDVARYADKILKGAKPAELPVERPTRIRLVINLTTAKKLGVQIPYALRMRADEVVN